MSIEPTYGLSTGDIRRLERALRALSEFQHQIKRALTEECRGSARDHANVCNALRLLVGQ